MPMHTNSVTVCIGESHLDCFNGSINGRAHITPVFPRPVGRTISELRDEFISVAFRAR